MSSFNETQSVVFVILQVTVVAHNSTVRPTPIHCLTPSYLKSGSGVLASALWHAVVSPRLVQFRNIQSD